ncbi:MAG: hypothetical protein A2089_04680 [Elusimicrobia bacterium GWD2_63_28]|nr:MAG: hypothetical protein A2089_04680 [Elusimicrobia bacterium GWD2_63_28]
MVQAAPLTAAFQSAPPAPPASPGFSAAARAFYPETLSPAEFDGGTARGRAALAPDARAAEFLFITDEMKRVYSHLENKERLFSFSFEALKADYLAKVSAAASETDYRRLVQNFISAFSDPHLAIRFAQPSGGKNAAERIISNDVTGDGILVTRIERLYGTPQELEQLSAGLDESLTLAKTARALVVDMRGNPGGNDAYGRYFISRLVAHFIPTGKTTVKISRETIERYGSRLQEDPARPGWGTWWEGGVEPQTEESFKGPLALLIDGGCVSSCEGTAVMFKFSGAARLYGAATMGSSGYPAIIELPGGRGQVYIPTWIRIMPDGNPIEDHGVYPDVETDPAQALERALADIRAE